MDLYNFPLITQSVNVNMTPYFNTGVRSMSLTTQHGEDASPLSILKVTSFKLVILAGDRI